MIQVSKKQFYEFLLDKQHHKTQGGTFHSEYFACNKTGEKIAYMETSSWGAPDTYKIKVPEGVNEENYNTLLILNKKLC